MSKMKWHKGPPPCVGWYNATARVMYAEEHMYTKDQMSGFYIVEKVVKSTEYWRWWDGVKWSLSYSCLYSANMTRVSYPINQDTDIEWTTYWPKNARVPDTRNLKGYK